MVSSLTTENSIFENKMYINKDEMERRLNKTSLQVIEKKRKSRGGLGVGEKRLSHEDRVLIGALNEIDTQKNIAELVGVSQTTVSSVSRGMVAPSVGVNKELRNDVESRIGEIARSKEDHQKKIEDQLITNLAAALGQVANNLESTDAPEASKIAVDMSKILDRVNGNKETKGNRTAIIINVPTMKEEKAYTSITV